jgi:hypothetical protein
MRWRAFLKFSLPGYVNYISQRQVLQRGKSIATKDHKDRKESKKHLIPTAESPLDCRRVLI